MILTSPETMSDNTIDNSIHQLREITIQQQNAIKSIQTTFAIQQNDIADIKTTIADMNTSINHMFHSLSEIATKFGFEITLPPPLPIPRTPPTPPSAVAVAPSLYATVADATTAAPSPPKSLTPLHPYPANPTLLPATVAGSTTTPPPSPKFPAPPTLPPVAAANPTTSPSPLDRIQPDSAPLTLTLTQSNTIKTTCNLFDSCLTQIEVSGSLIGTSALPSTLSLLKIPQRTATPRPHLSEHSGKLNPYASANIDLECRSATKPDDSCSVKSNWSERFSSILPSSSNDLDLPASHTTDPISCTTFDSTFNVVFPIFITVPPHISNNRSSHTHFPINEHDHTKHPRSNPKPLDTNEIFILDFQTHDIVSTLIHAKDLRNHDVALYVPVDNSNCKQIASDIFNQLKQSFHLNFILPPPRSFLEKLTSDLARSNLMSNGSRTQSGYFYDLDTGSIDFGLNNLEQRFDFSCKRGWPTFSSDETVYFHGKDDVKWWSFSQVVLMEMETLVSSRDGKWIALNRSTKDKALLFVFNYSMGLHSILDPAKSSLSIKTLRKNILFNFDPGGKIKLESLFVAWFVHSDTQLYHNSDITTSTAKAPTYDLEDKVDFEGSVMIRLHMQSICNSLLKEL